MTRRARKWRAVLLGSIFALFAFEVAMQALAYLTWRKHDGFVVRSVASDRAILCIGDSFTFGLGASGGFDYPRQLESILRESVADAVVVNGGKAGQDSADVLRRLPAQFDAVKPRLVYVLVGYNDRFRHPKAIDVRDAPATQQDSAFPLRLRTADLIGRLWHAAFGEDPALERDVSPLLGTWHRGDFEIEFREDGDLRVGERHSRWSRSGVRVNIALQPDEPIEATWQVTGDMLSLSSESLGPDPLRFDRGARRVDVRSSIEVALTAGDLALAERLLVAAEAGGDRSVGLLALRARWLFGMGRVADADTMFATIESEVSRSGELADIEALVAAYFAIHRSQPAVALACATLASRPAESELWWMLVRHSAVHPGEDAVILATVDSALAVAGPTEPWRAALHRLRAGILDRQPGGEVAAIASTVRAALIDGNETNVVQRLTDRPPSRANFDAALETLRPTDRERAEAEQWWHDATSAERQPAAVLSQHLTRMAEFCRARGAQLVILNYPEPLGELGDAIAATVRRQALPWIDVEADFRVALRTIPRDELFVADGHCNDAGYARIAKLVAADARERL